MSAPVQPPRLPLAIVQKRRSPDHEDRFEIGLPRSGQVRLRVLRRTDGERLCPHVQGYSFEKATVYTDEWKGYNQVERDRQTVCHSDSEWAQDEDGDDIREVHVNTIEGPQATLRNFLRPFQGVHKKYLASYVAICEFAINLKRITPAFIAALVRGQDF